MHTAKSQMAVPKIRKAASNEINTLKWTKKKWQAIWERKRQNEQKTTKKKWNEDKASHSETELFSLLIYQWLPFVVLTSLMFECVCEFFFRMHSVALTLLSICRWLCDSWLCGKREREKKQSVCVCHFENTFIYYFCFLRALVVLC